MFFFFVIIAKGNNFYDFLFTFLRSKNDSKMRSTRKGKQLLLEELIPCFELIPTKGVQNENGRVSFP